MERSRARPALRWHHAPKLRCQVGHHEALFSRAECMEGQGAPEGGALLHAPVTCSLEAYKISLCFLCRHCQAYGCVDELSVG